MLAELTVQDCLGPVPTHLIVIGLVLFKLPGSVPKSFPMGDVPRSFKFPGNVAKHNGMLVGGRMHCRHVLLYGNDPTHCYGSLQTKFVFYIIDVLAVTGKREAVR